MTNTFAAVKAALLPRHGVETSRMFGSEGLKVSGKVFAMQVKGQLVVKLTADRAAQLVAAERATTFDPGHGRPMKQWIAVPATTELDWRVLAEEAMALVGG